MVKNYIFVFFMVFIQTVFSQKEAQKNIHLNITFHKNVNLFFPSPVVRGEVGNNNFGFVYNRNAPDILATLKAKPGPDSNLLVITEDGNVYSFILSYKEDVPGDSLNVFVKEDWSIRNLNGSESIVSLAMESIQEQPKDFTENIKDNDFYEADNVDGMQVDYQQPKRGEQSELYLNDRQAYYKKHSSNQLFKGRRKYRIRIENEGVELELINLEYNKNEMYFTFTITNNSSLDFVMNYIRFYVSTKNKSKRISTQAIPKEHVYSYNSPDRVKAGSSKSFVYVFNQFSINKKKSFIVELYEQKGERNLELPLDNSVINNPN